MGILAACHIHSSWSYDGSWSLEDLAAKFSGQGYRVLMMTEHDRGFNEQRFQEYRRACAEASSEKIIIVPGIEYSDADNLIHVLVWGLNSFLGENLPTNTMLKLMASQNGVAVLAHPSRRKAWSSFEPQWEDRLLGIEGWNRKYDGWAPSKDASSLLRTRQTIPFVGLDFHTIRQSFPLAMALELNCAITEASVVECFRSGNCYATVFGRALTDSIVYKARTILNTAELGRRAARRLYRSAKSFAAKAQRT